MTVISPPPRRSPLDKLDAAERRALTMTAFVAACVCFAPAELVSGVLLVIVAAALYQWDQRVTRRELAAAKAAEAAAPKEEPPVEGPSDRDPPPAA